MTFERMPQPKNGVEEENKGKFEQPADIVASRFFDDFIGKNSKIVEAGNLGIAGHDLDAGIRMLVAAAENEKGKEYADGLAKNVLANLDIYRPIVPDKEKDPAVKVEAKEYLLSYIVPGGEIDFERGN